MRRSGSIRSRSTPKCHPERTLTRRLSRQTARHGFALGHTPARGKNGSRGRNPPAASSHYRPIPTCRSVAGRLPKTRRIEQHAGGWNRRLQRARSWVADLHSTAASNRLHPIAKCRLGQQMFQVLLHQRGAPPRQRTPWHDHSECWGQRHSSGSSCRHPIPTYLQTERREYCRRTRPCARGLRRMPWHGRNAGWDRCFVSASIRVETWMVPPEDPIVMMIQEFCGWIVANTCWAGARGWAVFQIGACFRSLYPSVP